MMYGLNNIGGYNMMGGWGVWGGIAGLIGFALLSFIFSVIFWWIRNWFDKK